MSNSCDTCIRYKKQRLRPVVAMLMACVFNETVAMDLKIWRNFVFSRHNRHSNAFLYCISYCKQKSRNNSGKVVHLLNRVIWGTKTIFVRQRRGI